MHSFQKLIKKLSTYDSSPSNRILALKTFLISKHSLARSKLNKETDLPNFVTNLVLSEKAMNVSTLCKSIKYLFKFYSIASKAKDLQKRSHELADDYYGIAAEIK